MYTGIHVFDLRNIRRDIHSGQIIYQPFASLRKTYHIERILPKSVFRKDYPENPKTFGEYLRKARIDAGLQIKDLAKELGVTEDTVINWEIRGRMPRPRAMEALGKVFGGRKENKENKIIVMPAGDML